MAKSNKNKIILDLCGGTGAWSEPYRQAGYDVRIVTLPDFDVRHWRNTWLSELVFNGKVHGILAAPPCTMFSRARTTAKAPRDYESAMEVVNACLEIVHTARKSGSLKWWALENPMGYLRQFIGNPPHSFRGWEYGDKHVKFTDIWGYYRMPVGRFKNMLAFSTKEYAAPRAPKQYAHLKLSRADIRAITPARFARAFAKLNT